MNSKITRIVGQIVRNFEEYEALRGDHNPIREYCSLPGPRGERIKNGVTVEVGLLWSLRDEFKRLPQLPEPIKPYAYHFEWAHVVTTDGPGDWRPVFSLEEPGPDDTHFYYYGDRIRNMRRLYEEQ